MGSVGEDAGGEEEEDERRRKKKTRYCVILIIIIIITCIIRFKCINNIIKESEERVIKERCGN